ncbi:MAG: glycosyltransferase [Pseudomonadota bacterium]
MPDAHLQVLPGLEGLSGVTHFALDNDGDIAEAQSPTGDTFMTVFWRSGYPVGHVLRLADGRERTAMATQPRNAVSSLPRGRTISVVICTRDRPDELRRCLASLPQQSLRPDQIIVVDNASKDERTRQVAEAAGVIYVREDRPGLDYARNTGASSATADIIAYTDDDVLLHPRWLEHLVAAFDEPRIGAVTGLVLPAELATPAQRQFESFWSFGQGYDRIEFLSSDFALTAPSQVFPAWKVGAGASMAFRREVFERVGLFDERLDVGQAGCSGDSEFWYRLLANGIDCRYEPTSVAFHFHRREMDGLAFQIYSYMRGHAAALMVQHERTGLSCNRRRALWQMPRWYASRTLRRLRRGPVAEDVFLKQEIAGFFAGLLFYYRQRGKHGR